MISGNKVFRPGVIAVGCFFFVITVLSAARSFQREVSHDENQFIASGAVLEENATLPYLDYPYFHMPDLVFVYALIAALSNYYFLATHISSVLFSVLTLGVIFWWATRLFSHCSEVLRLLIAMMAVLLIFTNPIFLDASGYAVNQDLSMLFALVSVAIIVPPKEKTLGFWRAFVSGLFMGMATGTRLTYAPAILPLLLISLFSFKSHLNGNMAKNALAVASGFAVALIPALILFFIAPQQFIFGNITYASLNTMYQFQIGGWSSILTRSGKILFVRDAIIKEPRNLILFAGFVTVSFNEIWRMIKTRRLEFHGYYWAAVMVLTFILLGTMMPNPIWGQYLYAPLPLLVMGMLAGMSALTHTRIATWGICGFLFLTAIFGITSSLPSYSNPEIVLQPNEWVPVAVHEEAILINRLKGAGPVLTLGPLYVLDGNVQIYPPLVTGPFAWRVGDLVDASTKKRMNLLTPSNLADALEENPPGAILVGIEGEDLEKPLIDYARNNNYQSIDLGNGHTLWVPREK